MTLKDKLKFLKYAERFHVKEDYHDENVYKITMVEGSFDGELVAYIDLRTKTAKYYRADCYNSGNDELEIDIDNLLELKEFIELLLKGE